MSSMQKSLFNQQGSLAVIGGFVVMGLALIGLIIFGAWSFGERSTYKSKSDQLVATAVAENTKKVQAEEAVKYAEAAKNPLKTYVGPDAYGSVRMEFPKTWSAYNQGIPNGATPVDVFLNPDIVPPVNAQDATFALRVQVLASTYSSVLGQYTAQQRTGKVTVAPFRLTAVPSVVGSRVDGQITPKKQGSVIILPLRDKTLKVWTESETFMNDFNNIILPKLSFVP
ncbi:MAG TPA: hypothetical protein PLT04_00650 [Candidatus Saccharibacteria bacterium]|nr:hypothetical protein [Candidatus Saccharibacteria bacterium]